jgi:hypothetical protein
VFNGQIKGWGLGIFVYQDCIIDHLIVSSNITDGINCGAGTVISNCVAGNNGGRGITGSDNVLVTHCTATENNGEGLLIFDDSRAEHCVCNRNGDIGIAFVTGSSVTDCTANFNGRKIASPGFAVINAGTRDTISRSTANGNSSYGIAIGGNSSISDCSINNNTMDGIFSFSNAEMQGSIARCVVNENATAGGNGITLNEYATVTDCVIMKN